MTTSLAIDHTKRLPDFHPQTLWVLQKLLLHHALQGLLSNPKQAVPSPPVICGGNSQPNINTFINLFLSIRVTDHFLLYVFINISILKVRQRSMPGKANLPGNEADRRHKLRKPILFHVRSLQLRNRHKVFLILGMPLFPCRRR